MNKYNSNDKQVTIGITLIVLSLLLSVFLLGLLNELSATVINFFVGVFGYSIYAITIAALLIGISLLMKNEFSATAVVLIKYITLFILFVATLHMITSHDYFSNPSFGEYIGACYKGADTAGGAFFAILVYYPVKALTYLATIIIFIAAFILLLSTLIYSELKEKNYFRYKFTPREHNAKKERRLKIYSDRNYGGYDEFAMRKNEFDADEENVSKDLFIAQKTVSKLNDDEELTVKKFPVKEESAHQDYFQEGVTSPTHDFSQYYRQNISKSLYQDEKPARVIEEEAEEKKSTYTPVFYDDYAKTKDCYTTNYMAKKIQNASENNYDLQREREEKRLDSWMNSSMEKSIEDDKNAYMNYGAGLGKVSPKKSGEYYSPEIFESNRNEIKPFDNVSRPFGDSEEKPIKSALYGNETNNDMSLNTSESLSNKYNIPIKKSLQVSSEQKYAKVEKDVSVFSETSKQILNRRYKHPPVELLKDYPAPAHRENIEEKSRLLETVLSSFNVNAKVVNYVEGPAFVMYELQIPPGVSVKKIAQFDLDLQSSLELTNKVGILAPIPGKNAVGIELPKENPSTVSLKELFENGDFFKNPKLSPIAFCLGKDISGKVYFCDIKSAPHILIAGATNSGKSVGIHIMLASIIYKSSPEEVKFILVDPKRVEFNVYSGLPHLLLKDIISDVEHTLKALDWCIDEMERRYMLFQQADSRRNIIEFNEYVEKTGKFEKLPYIVFVIDELADLMSSPGQKKSLENRIVRLAQKSRASGIHLVFATQRPSADVVTGVIKANLPTRIVFSVSSYVDSNVALTRGGAEKLLGRGDMYYKPVDRPEPIRMQGAYISNDEVLDIVNYVKENNEAYFDEMIENAVNSVPQEENEQDFNSDGGESSDAPFSDPLMAKALYLFVTKRDKAGATAIQTRFNVGWARAKRLINEMEDAKFISPQSGGNKARDVLITLEDYYKIFGNEEAEQDGDI